jgi:hypothetical protein
VDLTDEEYDALDEELSPLFSLLLSLAENMNFSYTLVHA